MIYGIIAGAIKNNDVSFVFPSETAAAMWARRMCFAETPEGGRIRSVAVNRFMAWDRFKEEAVYAEVRGKKPVSAVLRKLFAQALLRENAAAPFLKAIISPAYADNSEAFARSTAAMLPSLAYWEARRGGRPADTEDSDLFAVKVRYASFLEQSGLFEPSWEKPAFRGNGRYIIFFPGAIEDFPEYEEILDCYQITLAGKDSDGGTAAAVPGLRFFDSAREEIRAAALEMRRIHGEGTAWTDMAISLPGGGEPYLTRELQLYDIPFNVRAGKNLGEYGNGRLFSLVNECAASAFSFDSLKSLVLDTFIPWKNPVLNRELVTFGINNHCVSPFTGKNRETVDVWEEAFRRAARPELEKHYAAVKHGVSGLAGSKTFEELREKYFAFRALLDMEQCPSESSDILARCIRELSSLAELERAYPEPFSRLSKSPPVSGISAFFVSHLKEKKYVPVRESGGVNIYGYPVAAGAPFAAHFVLNASQGAAAVQYRPLGFLRQDKRNRLGTGDRDASAAIFRLFCAGSECPAPARPVWFSASEKSFSGWAIPHAFFAAEPACVPSARDTADDLYLAERIWWPAFSGGAPDGGGSMDAAFPDVLFPLQKKGFERWSSVLLAAQTPGSVFTRGPFGGAAAAMLAERVNRRKRPASSGGTGVLSVSATDLTEFFSCPALWLYRRIFDLEAYPLDAAMIDDRSLGSVYHKILQELFGRIKRDREGKFDSAKIEQYRTWADEISVSVIRDSGEFRGQIAWPLLESLAAAAAKRIRAMLKTEARHFAGFRVELLEEKLSAAISAKAGGVMLTGKIDRVSLSSEGAVIIDYKTGGMPTQQSCTLTGGTLADFQIPVYIKLYEETAKDRANGGRQVSGAYFFSINSNSILQIAGTLPHRRGLSRENYQETIDTLGKYAEHFAAALARFDFAAETVPGGQCVSCPYKTICRSLYTLNPVPKNAREGNSASLS